MKKRLISAILSIVMIVSLFLVSALAEEPQPEIRTAVTDYFGNYKMLYVFVPTAEDGKTACVTYNGEKVYDITDLGYQWKSNTGDAATIMTARHSVEQCDCGAAQHDKRRDRNAEICRESGCCKRELSRQRVLSGGGYPRF